LGESVGPYSLRDSGKHKAKWGKRGEKMDNALEARAWPTTFGQQKKHVKGGKEDKNENLEKGTTRAIARRPTEWGEKKNDLKVGRRVRYNQRNRVEKGPRGEERV